ncbi:MAG: ThiF family adenylyltransferase [Paracoccaceae bacterium]
MRGPESDRYARQTALAEVGAGGQARLGAATALVVGAGGLGAPVIQYLAGAGVRRLVIVDPDRVETTNLHRQTLFTESDLGRAKAEAAAGFAARLNGEVSVGAVVDRLDPANVGRRLEGVDVALDCADSFAASYTLSDACLERGIPLISASALGREGYAGGFCGAAPSLRAVFPEMPERAATCATAGVLGPVVGVLGSLQAQMALSVLLGLAPSPLGLMVSMDAAMRFSRFRFDTAPEPPGGPRFVAPSQIRAEDFVVELRGEDEAPEPAAPGARRRVVEDVGAGPLPAPGQRAVLACATGLRSWRAARRLARVWDGEIVLVAAG